MRHSIFLLLLTMSTSIEASVVVERIQMPAWLLQQNQMQVLRPGVQLEDTDSVITGKNAKVYLKLDEGSRIKLGQQARFEVSSVSIKKQAENPQKQGLFTAVFKVLKGAFRFTTSELFKTRRRDIDIKIGTVTAGIRGTDLWGKSDDDNDLVCLIEGKISVSKAGGDAVVLNEPSAYLTANQNESLSETQYVSDQKLAQWAATTEINDSSGSITKIGRFAVQLLSVVNEEVAVNVVQVLNKAGYPASLSKKFINGAEWNRVSVNGFESVASARLFAASIDGKYSIKNPWVSNAEVP